MNYFTVHGNTCRISVFDFDRHLAWQVNVSRGWFTRNDPGHAVSIGFVLGEDITSDQLAYFAARGRVNAVDYPMAIVSNYHGCKF